MFLSPRQSACYISENSEHVQVNKDAIIPIAAKFCEDLKNGAFGSSWDSNAMHPKAIGPSTVNWIFIVDSLNFSFWTEKAHYTVTFHGTAYTGYIALCAAVNRAIEEGINLLDPYVLVNLTLLDAKRVFRSDDDEVDIPLIEARLDILRLHGRILLEVFGGCFTECIRRCHKSSEELIKLLCTHFSSFRDEAEYKGKNVTFYKRAQILCADIWVAFKGVSFGEFNDIDSLTAFADYRVPQVLAYFGVLQYDRFLMDKLKENELLESGSSLEVEIRGTCLHAVELIVNATKSYLKESGVNDNVICNSILADNFLWLYRRKHCIDVEKTVPMHRTRCIYY